MEQFSIFIYIPLNINNFCLKLVFFVAEEIVQKNAQPGRRFAATLSKRCNSIFSYDIEEKTTENAETRENADSVLAGNEGDMKNAGKAENVAMLKVVTNEKGEALGEVLTIIC